MRVGAATVFRLRGVFGAGVDFSALRAAFGRAAGEQVRAVFLDMAHVTTLDGIGLGELIRLRMCVHESGRLFGLVNLVPHQQRLVDLARLSTLLGVRRLGDGALSNAAFKGTIGSDAPFGRFAEPRKVGSGRRVRLAVV